MPTESLDAPHVQVQATNMGAVAPDPAVKKVIVSVHGVGDQLSFATLQSVVNRFCAYYQEPPAVPLGHFHTGHSSYCLPAPYPTEPFETLAFAEVYWAQIPRNLVSEQHTLEEAKQWASTIVERLRLRWRQEQTSTEKQVSAKKEFQPPDFARLKQVLGELIQTLAVLERLCFLAERAGLFSFDLRKLLDDYLGDVQVVAEFETERTKILDTFSKTMQGVKTTYANAEIYIVAHSEGTVVALLGLLAALRAPQEGTTEWVANVRGLMTFGSPIDKHLILWPELFVAEGLSQVQPRPETQKIEWRNYYDRGDPIGFSLDDARQWIAENGLTGVFNFQEEDDIGFTRYPFPGKAHVDYWQDDEVFGHFIRQVVNPQPPVADRRTAWNAATAHFTTPPGDIRWKKWLSYVLPYIGILAILFVGVYIVFKALTNYTDPKGLVYADNGLIFRDVASLTLLTFGVTVAARIPRITSAWGWRLGAVLFYLVLAVCCFWLVPFETSSKQDLYLTFAPQFGVVHVLVATIVLLLASLVGALWPAWGLVPLLGLGTAAIVGVGLLHYTADVRTHTTDAAPLWPVFPATAAFFYLWWLAALIFDLVFVWHVQIRQEQALARMDRMVNSAARQSASPPVDVVRVSTSVAR